MIGELIFWSSALAVVYIYFGHPAVLWLLATFRPRPWKSDPVTPSISVYVPAYNEEAAIASKIELLLEQDYQGTFEIVVANDGSTDRTAEIVRQFEPDDRVRFFDYSRNRGKAIVQNEIIPCLKSEVVVFTDTTARFPPDTLSRIASHFADEEVGAVAVDISFVRRESGSVEQGQRGYWRYERFLRIQGSRFWTNISASGACYAIRRNMFKSLPVDVSEDLANPLQVAFAGKRVVFDPDCVVEEMANTRHDAEMRMRRRVAVRGITALTRYWRYLNPLRGFAAYQLFLHKYCRFLCWIPMVLALFSNGYLAPQHPVYLLLFAGQLLFYSAALAGYLLENKGVGAGPARIPYYFVVLNFIYALAIWDYVRGVRRATWKTERV